MPAELPPHPFAPLSDPHASEADFVSYGVRLPTRGALVADRYELRERIGVGGSAQVFRAWHRGLRSEVALKLVFAGDARSIERFVREAERSRRVIHPRLPQAYDAGWCEVYGCYYLALTLLEGERLDARLERLGPRPRAEMEIVLGDLASALSALHREGIVHRDVSSSNVLVRTNERDEVVSAHLVDLGLSFEPAAPRLTSQGHRFSRTDPETPTPLVDQRALAALALELLGVELYEVRPRRLAKALERAYRDDAHAYRDVLHLAWAVEGLDVPGPGITRARVRWSIAIAWMVLTLPLTLRHAHVAFLTFADAFGALSSRTGTWPLPDDVLPPVGESPISSLVTIATDDSRDEPRASVGASSSATSSAVPTAARASTGAARAADSAPRSTTLPSR
jgi:hypothetical protein